MLRTHRNRYDIAMYRPGSSHAEVPAAARLLATSSRSAEACPKAPHGDPAMGLAAFRFSGKR